ncbi:hypothetical protein HYDPIDRAFT_99022 [Hydnomerulius pinastri MD-312]|uniref:Major facilitator superfamily (MFS) profile domain-containing protein n=1 Tax=Hydnomerulius pinastri MD-312 TaxID=994086 RepID=A0A0C9VR86_9AGAM|nr:hypothetical protein HYDPIDRAFT_99022 [Hydnomerulius pinastri MD-312]
MSDIEKQPSSPARKSTLDAATCDTSPRNSTLIPSDAPLIPDAGECEYNRLKAWMAVFGAFLALFCSFGQINAFGTFQSFYSTHQLSSMSPFSISWIGSLQLWVFFFMGGPIGCLFDAYGPTPLLCSGSILLVSSLVLTSVAVEYYQYLLAQGVLFGLGAAMLFYPTIASVATHFNEYRATAIGIASAGSGCGGVIYPVMLRYLFDTVGFGWATRISALIASVLCVPAILSVKPLLRIKKKEGSLIEIRMIKDGRFLLLVAGSFFVCFGIFTPYFYISDYAESINIPSNTAFYILSLMNAGGVIGRIAPAWLSDKIGRFNLLCPSAFLAGLSCLVLWMFGRNLAAMAIFATIYGFLSGAFVSVVTPCVAQISEIGEIGTRIGALYTFISIPSLFGGPIAGALLQQQGSFTASIALAGSTMILGSVFLLASKLTIDRRFLCHI